MAIFRYLVKVNSLTIVIAMMPDPEPIKSKEPPNPTVYARRIHRLGVVVFTISMDAAVNGMLSNTADKKPSRILPEMTLPVVGVLVKM